MSKILECGCVVGQYWCSKHDIYNKQDPNDPPHRIGSDVAPECCSCHISAPCSFCTRETENTDNE